MSAHSASEASEIPELDALRGDDEPGAQEAFARLWGSVRPAVFRQLARWDVRGDEAEDVAQDAAARLWAGRRNVAARTPGGWAALVRKTVHHNLLDRWGARTREAEMEAEVPPEEVPYLDAVVTASLESRRIFEAADELWLGTPADPEEAEIAAAALTLVLADGVPPEEAAVMFAVAPEAVERWLDDPALVARAGFTALCWPSDALAGHVLRPERPLSPAELDGIARGASGPGTMARRTANSSSTGSDRAVPALEGWSASEARAVCLRVRNGLEADQIVRASEDLDESRVDEVLRRARGAYPFRLRARALLRSLERRGQARGLKSTGIWRRMAFEYHARYGLTRDHIVERAGPPAEEASVLLGVTVLDNWLSRGRIYAQLAAYLQEAGG